MSRPERLTADDRARMNHLLGKKNLTGLERGELAALGAAGSEADRAAANARVGHSQPASAAAGTDPEFARKLGEKVGRNVARYLDEGA
jgi:hypothetical protein